MGYENRVLAEIERLEDLAPIGRASVVRNEAWRCIWRRLESDRRTPESRGGRARITDRKIAGSEFRRPWRGRA
jgi:hypothetical protein